MDLIARRVSEGSAFLLLRDGRQFGRLFDCEVCWLYEGDYQEEITGQLAGDMSVREMLPIIRSTLEALDAEADAEYEAERYAEGAWLRRSEYDPEAFDEMIRQDMMGLR